LFQKLYGQELESLFASGISYDWDQSDTIEYDETLYPRQRRLRRM